MFCGHAKSQKGIYMFLLKSHWGWVEELIRSVGTLRQHTGIYTVCRKATEAHRDVYFPLGELEEAQRNLHSLWKRQGSTTKVNTYTPPQLGLGTHRFKTDCEMGEGGA